MSTDSYKIYLSLFTKQLLHCYCQTIKDTAKEQQVSTFMLSLKHFCEQQRMQRPASTQTHCHCQGNCSLASGGGKVHRTQQPQRPDEISVMLKLRFGLCKILILYMQLSQTNCCSVLGNTKWEELSRITKKMEVNKAFFMSTSYPHKYNANDSATVPRICTSSALLEVSCSVLAEEATIDQLIAELDPTNNAEELFLPGFLSN